MTMALKSCCEGIVGELKEKYWEGVKGIIEGGQKRKRVQMLKEKEKEKEERLEEYKTEGEEERWRKRKIGGDEKVEALTISAATAATAAAVTSMISSRVKMSKFDAHICVDAEGNTENDDDICGSQHFGRNVKSKEDRKNWAEEGKRRKEMFCDGEEGCKDLSKEEFLLEEMRLKKRRMMWAKEEEGEENEEEEEEETVAKGRKKRTKMLKELMKYFVEEKEMNASEMCWMDVRVELEEKEWFEVDEFLECKSYFLEELRMFLQTEKTEEEEEEKKKNVRKEIEEPPGEVREIFKYREDGKEEKREVDMTEKRKREMKGNYLSKLFKDDKEEKEGKKEKKVDEKCCYDEEKTEGRKKTMVRDGRRERDVKFSNRKDFYENVSFYCGDRNSSESHQIEKEKTTDEVEYIGVKRKGNGEEQKCISEGNQSREEKKLEVGKDEEVDNNSENENNSMNEVLKAGNIYDKKEVERMHKKRKDVEGMDRKRKEVGRIDREGKEGKGKEGRSMEREGKGNNGCSSGMEGEGEKRKEFLYVGKSGCEMMEIIGEDCFIDVNKQEKSNVKLINKKEEKRLKYEENEEKRQRISEEEEIGRRRRRRRRTSRERGMQEYIKGVGYEEEEEEKGEGKGRKEENTLKLRNTENIEKRNRQEETREKRDKREDKNEEMKKKIRERENRGEMKEKGGEMIKRNEKGKVRGEEKIDSRGKKNGGFDFSCVSIIDVDSESDEDSGEEKEREEKKEEKKKRGEEIVGDKEGKGREEKGKRTRKEIRGEEKEEKEKEDNWREGEEGRERGKRNHERSMLRKSDEEGRREEEKRCDTRIKMREEMDDVNKEIERISEKKGSSQEIGKNNMKKKREEMKIDRALKCNSVKEVMKGFWEVFEMAEIIKQKEKEKKEGGRRSRPRNCLQYISAGIEVTRHSSFDLREEKMEKKG